MAESCLSVYTITINGSSFHTLAQIFPEFHTWVQFSLKREAILKILKGT